MTDFVAQLRSKIGEKNEAIQRLDRDRDRLVAEKAAYEEMLLIAEEAARPAAANGAQLVPQRPSSRGLSPEWTAIMKRLGSHESFDYDDAVREALKEGIETDKKSMRSRMYTYVNSGYVERVGEGQLRVTSKGQGAE